MEPIPESQIAPNPAPLLFTALRGGLRGFGPPADLATWLNPILTAPLAEELLFRGLVFRLLRERFNLIVAFSASAFLFALSHVPYWLMTQTPGLLALNLISIAGYGVLFAALYLWSGSLWAPLLCHSLNNFMHSSLHLH